MKKIIVASHNPVKLQAVQLGFQSVFPGEPFQWESVQSPSGVSDQPYSDQETLLGAKNRLEFIHQNHPHADFWAALEGGITFDEEGRMSAFAWIVIRDHQLYGKARTGTFYLPPKIAALVKQGYELGDADDLVFNQSNSKQNNGAVGLLSNNLITRTTLYQQAVILALLPLINRSLYLEYPTS